MWYWYKGRKIDQWRIIENTKTDIYRQTVFDKGSEAV